MVENLHIFALKKIKEMVCREFGVSMNDLISDRKTKDIIVPRQVAYMLCRDLTPLSLPRIGRAFGDRDHSTIMTGIKRAKTILGEYPDIARVADKIKKDFENDHPVSNR